MPRTKKKTEYCAGYLDVYGQWNNGFHCVRWKSKPGLSFCCGPRDDRFCCGKDEATFPTAEPTTVAFVNRPVDNAVNGEEAGGSGVSSGVLWAVCGTGAVLLLLLIFISLLCCLHYRCPLARARRRRKQQLQYHAPPGARDYTRDYTQTYKPRTPNTEVRWLHPGLTTTQVVRPTLPVPRGTYSNVGNSCGLYEVSKIQFGYDSADSCSSDEGDYSKIELVTG